ncbi:MAG: hypothetical protein COA78_06145 [Blastopirellula sp.]|nr:MAG: hypothetical protein COA78_06145 [Blastopirellula sp.]
MIILLLMLLDNMNNLKSDISTEIEHVYTKNAEHFFCNDLCTIKCSETSESITNENANSEYSLCNRYYSNSTQFNSPSSINHVQSKSEASQKYQTQNSLGFIKTIQKQMSKPQIQQTVVLSLFLTFCGLLIAVERCVNRYHTSKVMMSYKNRFSR